MKNLKTKFLLFTLFCTSLAYAQITITDAVLTYTISIETTNGEKQLSSALNGATLNIYLAKDKSRTEMVSKLGTETTVFDNKLGNGFILKEYSGQKLMITVTADNWALKNQVNNNLAFKETTETATIAGIACKKATSTSDDGKNYTVFYDPTTIITNKKYNNAFAKLLGMPVQYSLQSGNLVFKYTLQKNNAEILPTYKFDAPKAGFRVMTYEENQQMKRGD